MTIFSHLAHHSKLQSWLYVLNTLFAWWLLQTLLQWAPLGWDWTEEKRYTLSPASEGLLRDLPHSVEIEVYLEGDLPSAFRRLRTHTQSLLERMRRLSDHRISYRFTDPLQGQSVSGREAYLVSLATQGIQPTQLSYEKNGQRIQRWIFPSARIQTPNGQRAVLLLKGARHNTPDELINQSIEALEYHLMQAIEALTKAEQATIGIFTERQNRAKLKPLEDELNTRYIVTTSTSLDSLPIALNALDLLLVVAPTHSFSVAEAYALDHYLMQGGRLMFFLQGTTLDKGALSEEGTLLMPHTSGLEELLFAYGVRIHSHIVEDMHCVRYPVISGQVGNSPQWDAFPWPAFVLARQHAKHPITRNLESVLFQFTASLDTTSAFGILKTPLIYSSSYSRLRGAPAQIGLNEMTQVPNPKQFQAGPQMLALLLEGQFNSPYATRTNILRHVHGIATSNFKPQSPNTKIVVVGSASLPFADTDPRTQQQLPLGMYWPENKQYGQLDFITQSIAYLLDDKGLITARNKQIRIRPLNQIQINQNKALWQLVNIASPLLWIGLLAFSRRWYRRYRYTRKL